MSSIIDRQLDRAIANAEDLVTTQFAVLNDIAQECQNHLSITNLKRAAEHLAKCQDKMLLYKSARNATSEADFKRKTNVALDFKRNAEYKTFNQIVGDEVNSDDEIMFTQLDKTALICPISKKQMTLPVYSQCNHVFDKPAIENAIRVGGRNGQYSCPIVGCHHFIKLSNLKPHLPTQMMLQRQRLTQPKMADIEI